MQLEEFKPHEHALPPGLYSSLSALVEQIETTLPKIRRLRDGNGQPLMNRALALLVRAGEVMASLARWLRLPDTVGRGLDRFTAYLRGTPRPGHADVLDDQLPSGTGDRLLEDLSHNQRAIERRLADPAMPTVQRRSLQEDWIINRARWFARHEVRLGPVSGQVVPTESGLVAGAPGLPNVVRAHQDLIGHLRDRAAALRKDWPDDPRADLFLRAAQSYEIQLAGQPARRRYPPGLISPSVLRTAAHAVVREGVASPLVVQAAFGRHMPFDLANHTLQLLQDRGVAGPLPRTGPRTVTKAARENVDRLLSQEPAGGLAGPSAGEGPASTHVGTDDGLEEVLQERRSELSAAATRLQQQSGARRGTRSARRVRTAQTADPRVQQGQLGAVRQPAPSSRSHI
jgi:hypothetical protein